MEEQADWLAEAWDELHKVRPEFGYTNVKQRYGRPKGSSCRARPASLTTRMPFQTRKAVAGVLKKQLGL